MKKITFLLCFLMASAGFAQVNLEDFESAPIDFAGFEGLGGASIVANPSVDGNNGSATVGELIVADAGNPWQGANVILQDNYIDVSDPVTNAVTVDVYSTTSFTMLARVADGQAGAVDSAADAAHTGSGWEELTFIFNENLDGTLTANGEYGRIAFFPNWNGAGWNDPEIEITVYIDNITGTQGNSLVMAPEPMGPAPLPVAPDAQTLSIYDGNLPGDVTNYSTNWPYAYEFGSALAGEVDLDPSADVNGTWRFNFGLGGYGQGEGPVDASVYNFVSFDYWSPAGLVGFRFVMISNNGAVQEFNYQIGTNEPVVEETWTNVTIPMSYFTNQGFSSPNFFQWKFDPFDQSVDNAGVVYIDNILLTVNDPSLSVNQYDIANFKVYPNPSSNKWNISSNTVVNSVVLYDILGKQVMTLTPNTNDVVIEASSLNPGMYFAEINGVNGSKTVKLIRE